MSSSLPARAAALRDRLAALDAMASNVHETGLLTDLRDDLLKEVDALDRSLGQHQILVDASVPAPLPASLTTARKRAAGLRERFLQDPKAATLKKGTAWTSLIKEVGIAATDASSTTKKSWRDYRADVFTGDPPGVIKGLVAWTDRNQAAYQRYEAKHQLLRSAFEVMPQTAAEIARAKQIGADLRTIASEFDFNVPEEVKMFLAAVQAGGATLAHLTEDVVAWLKDNDAFGSYRIVPAR